MSLTVRTNTSALLAQDASRSNQLQISTAMQRLSTGLRINSAKDDAAGLAIADKMSSQIRGLSQAIRNIQDGISLVQTADSALGTITELLQRMRELSLQASTDTYTNEQRSYLHAEAMEIQSEIDRIKQAIEWNGKKLLDGSFIDQKIQIGANQDQKSPISIKGTGLADIGIIGGIGSDPAGSNTESAKITFTSLQIGQSITVDGLKFIAKKNITATEVATAYSNLMAGATSGLGSDYGEYIGKLKGYNTGNATSSQITATSTTANTNVKDIEISSNGVEKLSLPNVSTVQGNAAVIGQGSINEVKFTYLLPSQSITIGGLRFTANKTLSAEEVAIAFSNINGGATPGPMSDNGVFSGGLSWVYDSGPAVADTVEFKNSIKSPGSQISIRSDGMNQLNLPSITSIQGEPLYSGNPEIASIKFTGMLPNQQLSIKQKNGYINFMANKQLTGEQVAAEILKYQTEIAGNPLKTSENGYFSSINANFFSTAVNGNEIIATSNFNVSDPIYASLTLNGSTQNIIQPTIQIITSGLNPTGVTENVKINFNNMYTISNTNSGMNFGLYPGQSISIGNLTFTANKTLSYDQVAAAFASLSPNDTSGSASAADGVYSGIFRSDFSTSPVTLIPYTFQGNQHFYTVINATSTNPNTNIADLEIKGSSAMIAPILPTNSFTPGIADVPAHTEKSTITFPSMKIGQSLEIAGLNFTATSTLTSDQVALAFSNLADGSTTGSQQNLGIYSGKLADFRSGSSTSNTLSFISSATNAEVSDIKFSTGDLVASPQKPTTEITQGFADGVNLMTTFSAQNSIGRIDTAIKYVDDSRATLGSYINALTYINDNALNISANLQKSRSTIMDTDYAAETSKLASTQIIEQASTAMLAQANSQPKIVLELLKNL